MYSKQGERYMYSKQGEFVCMLMSVCVCVCMYACMYMYDVLVEIGGREKERRE